MGTLGNYFIGTSWAYTFAKCHCLSVSCRSISISAQAVVHTGKPLATCDYNKTLTQPRSRPIVESLMGFTVNGQKKVLFYHQLSKMQCNIIALFKNTQILKFKRQVTFAFLVAVNHLSRPLKEQMFTLKVQKVMVCDF